MTTRRARVASSQAPLGAAPRAEPIAKLSNKPRARSLSEAEPYTRPREKSKRTRRHTPIRTRRESEYDENVKRMRSDAGVIYNMQHVLTIVSCVVFAKHLHWLTRTPARLSSRLRPQSHATSSTACGHPRRPPPGRYSMWTVHKDPRARDIRMHALTSTPKLSNINLAVERCAVERTILQALCPDHLLLISAHHALDCPKRMDPAYAPL